MDSDLEMIQVDDINESLERIDSIGYTSRPFDNCLEKVVEMSDNDKNDVNSRYFNNYNKYLGERKQKNENTTIKKEKLVTNEIYLNEKDINIMIDYQKDTRNKKIKREFKEEGEEEILKPTKYLKKTQ